MYAMEIVKSTKANGEVDYWGPFPSEATAKEYIKAIKEDYGQDTECEIHHLINTNQFKVVKRG